MLYNFYIFNRECECVYYIEFQNRINFTQTGGLKPGSTIDYFIWPDYKQGYDMEYYNMNFNEAEFIEKNKLLYGTIFSLKNFILKLSEKLEDGFFTFSTDSYKLHYFETLSGLRFVLNSDINCKNQKDTLKYIFESIYINNILKNPLSITTNTSAMENINLNDDDEEGEEINNEIEDKVKGHSWSFNNHLFSSNLIKYLTQSGLI
ncbi:hypothetical protein K502DRAFT_310936 [Neoconidiobolus thromboides FSU 785]|nr:hypothetical protein K502DRAFT_310936 [Neoconidiobolus thromboides FSU 785]